MDNTFTWTQNFKVTVKMLLSLPFLEATNLFFVFFCVCICPKVF